MNRFTRRILPTVLATLIPLGLVTGCSEPTAEEHVASAQKMIAEGKLESARIELSSALQQAPNLAQARWLLGKVNLDLGDAPGAEKEIRKAIELGYEENHAQLELVRTLMLQNESAQVIKETNSLDPDIDSADHSALLGLRAQAFAATGDFEQAEAVAGEALELEPKSVPAMTGMALIHALQRDYGTAHQWLDRALEADPQSAEAWSLLGQVELEQGNAAKAEQALSKAIELRKHPSVEYAKRALARAQLDKFDDAASDLATLKKSGLGANPYVKYVEGVNLFRQKKYAEAAEAFEASKQGSKDTYLPREYYLASAYLALGRNQQASSQAELINKLAPKSALAQRLMGAVQINQAELEAATGFLKESVGSNPDDPVLLRMLGYVSMRLGNSADAVNYYEKALEIEPDSESTSNALELARLMAGQKFDQQTASSVAQTEDGANTFTHAFIKALALFRDGDLPGALREAKALGEKYPDNVEPIKLMAACHLAAGQWSEARQELSKVLEMKPDDSTAVQNLARLEIRDGNNDQARSLLNGLIKAHPTDTGAQELLARLIEATDGPAAAAAMLGQALERNPEALSLRNELARVYWVSGQHQRIIELTQGLDDKDFTKQPSLLERRARALFATGDADSARREFKRLLELFPKSAPAHFAYSESLVAANKMNEAAQHIKLAVELNPSYLPARVGQIRLMVRDKDLGGARKALSGLRKDFGNSYEVLDLEGWFALGSGDYTTATARYEELLASKPNTGALIQLVRSLWAEHKYDDAFKRMEGWLQEHPADVAVQMQLAEGYLTRERIADAGTLYKRIVDAHPDNVLALNNLAWLSRDDNRAQAIKYAEKALSLAPQEPNIMDTLGMLLLTGSDKSRGQKLIEQAAELAPNNTSIQIHLAQIMVENGSAPKARALLQSLLENAGDTPSAAEIRAALDAMP